MLDSDSSALQAPTKPSSYTPSPRSGFSRLDREFSRQIAPHLSPAACRFYDQLLDRHQDLRRSTTIQELAKQTGRDPRNVRSFVRLLVQTGLIEQVHEPDRPGVFWVRIVRVYAPILANIEEMKRQAGRVGQRLPLPVPVGRRPPAPVLALPPEPPPPAPALVLPLSPELAPSLPPPRPVPTPFKTPLEESKPGSNRSGDVDQLDPTPSSSPRSEILNPPSRGGARETGPAGGREARRASRPEPPSLTPEVQEAIRTTWPTYEPKTVLPWILPVLPLTTPEQLVRYIRATTKDPTLRTAGCVPRVALLEQRFRAWLAEDTRRQRVAALLPPALPTTIGAPRRPAGRPLDQSHALGARALLDALLAAPGPRRRP